MLLQIEIGKKKTYMIENREEGRRGGT